MTGGCAGAAPARSRRGARGLRAGGAKMPCGGAHRATFVPRFRRLEPAHVHERVPPARLRHRSAAAALRGRGAGRHRRRLAGGHHRELHGRRAETRGACCARRARTTRSCCTACRCRSASVDPLDERLPGRAGGAGRARSSRPGSRITSAGPASAATARTISGRCRTPKRRSRTSRAGSRACRSGSGAGSWSRTSRATSPFAARR